MPDHQFRPLFAFFKALVLPTSLYALEGDFDGFVLRNPDVEARVDRAAAEARRHLGLFEAVGSSVARLPLAVTA